MEEQATYNPFAVLGGGSKKSGPLLAKPPCAKCGRPAHEGRTFNTTYFPDDCDGYEPMQGDDDVQFPTATERSGAADADRGGADPDSDRAPSGDAGKPDPLSDQARVDELIAYCSGSKSLLGLTALAARMARKIGLSDREIIECFQP